MDFKVNDLPIVGKTIKKITVGYILEDEDNYISKEEYLEKYDKRDFWDRATYLCDNIGNDVVTFETTDGKLFYMMHSSDCSENVWLDDVNGDLHDLIGSEIIVAEERVYEDEDYDDHEFENREHISREINGSTTDVVESAFYTFRTRKGDVDMVWRSESNGWYSIDVDFFEPVLPCDIRVFETYE